MRAPLLRGGVPVGPRKFFGPKARFRGSEAERLRAGGKPASLCNGLDACLPDLHSVVNAKQATSTPEVGLVRYIAQSTKTSSVIGVAAKLVPSTIQVLDPSNGASSVIVTAAGFCPLST